MSISGITTSILSSLGNNTGSVIPIATKDLIQNQVLVATYKKDGGEHDAFEKFIEENGTSVVWLGGLPLIKKILDKTLYKAFKISPDADIRKLKKGASDSIEFAMNKLKEQGKAGGEQFSALKKIADNKNLAKGLFLTKFLVATGATMFALSKIILFKQKDTKEKVVQKVKVEMLQRHILRQNVAETGAGKLFAALQNGGVSSAENKKQNGKGVSFTGNPLSAFMYNPVLNQFLLDVGITSLRTGTSRKGERRDILVKEAFEIAFLYPLAAPIQKGLDVLFGKIFGKDTGLDYNVLASDTFKKSLSDNSIKGALDAFTKDFNLAEIGKNGAVDNKLLNFIYDNPDNAVVKFLKETGDVATVKKAVGKKFGLFTIKKATDEIDSLAYIDTKSIAKSIGKLSKTVNNIEKAGALGSVDKVAQYLKGAKAAKGLSILSAIAFGIWAMGVLQTEVVLKLRKDKTGSTENQAITNLENEIKHNMAFQGSHKGSALNPANGTALV